MLLDGLQSVLNPHSPEAAAIARIAWALFAGGAVLFLSVMALAALSLRGRRAWLASPRAIVAGGIAVPVVVLSALLVYAARAAPVGDEPPAIRVAVIGQQWWWRVRYLAPDGTVDFETANEIRLPVGRRVELALESADVLHSFWLPNLAGKLDMVPGRINRLRFTPGTAGIFRGQCAEYCGGPHAQMALFVVTDEPAVFERWRETQRIPATATHARFIERCAVCHTVRGTDAKGTLGPDLTHVGSRRSIAAATLPMDEASLARWMRASQHVKPGNLMPAFADLPPDDIAALAAYLAGLR